MSTCLHAIERLAQLQRAAIDRLALAQSAEDALAAGAQGRRQLDALATAARLPAPRWLADVQPEAAPALAWSSVDGWRVLRGTDALGRWVLDAYDAAARQWVEVILDSLEGLHIAKLKLTLDSETAQNEAWQVVKSELLAHSGALAEAGLGSLVINIVALFVSFYSMQVYDRVIPTSAEQTLLVLTLGVIGATLFEFGTKILRSSIYERVTDQVDQRLARAIFAKFLAIRLDQLPNSVGALASQLRGYETVRSFLMGLTNQMLVDAPFALLFLVVLAAVGGWLACIPAAFFVISLVLGLWYRSRVEALARRTSAATNQKTGLLVEAVEGAETIKSGQAGWRMLSRWVATTDDARGGELELRRISEHSQYTMAFLQQLCYVLVVALGAFQVTKGALSMGAVIAASILSGRILAPVAALPAQLIQWGHAKAALDGLNKLWRLEDDHAGQPPVVVNGITGDYLIENVEFRYAGSPALRLQTMRLRAGQKLGVIGPVGSGKTTLLRLLSGMYKPQTGRILLDGIDLSDLSKPVLAQKIGYLQQDGRLFAGSLRDNLILGLSDPGDELILQAAEATGLAASVIRTHPRGLQQPIFEGGSGLSGGQRQLVNLTRLLLRRPKVWLLDEPTASMDGALEAHIVETLRSVIAPSDTLALVTHKPELLSLVDRVIVVVNHTIMLDGPREDVLAQLRGNASGQLRRDGDEVAA